MKRSQAVRLFGALGARQPLGERDLVKAREGLGPEAFEAAWVGGRAMALEEALTGALAEGL